MCGQENTDRNVSFKDLTREFFNNYLSFDSKFGRSIKPFFINPGKLTSEFISGKRVNYANPIRLYLILSLFFFFILSKFNAVQNQDEGSGQFKISTNAGQKMTPQEADSIAAATRKIVADAIKDIPIDGQSDVYSQVADSTLSEEQLIATALDSLEAQGESFWPFETRANLEKYAELKDDQTITNQMLYDSLQTTALSSFQKVALRQVIRVSRAKSKELTGYIIEQMPLMMFLMLPIFALLLKLLYIRRNQNYIIHLVHSLHIHSFKYFTIGLATLIGIFTNPELSVKLIAGATILSVIYALLSFKKVYNQGFFKTLAKISLFYFSYFFLFIIGLVFEVLISAIFY